MRAHVLRTPLPGRHDFAHAQLAAARRRIAELEAQVAQLIRDTEAPPEPEFWTRFQGRHHRVRAHDLDWIEAERDYVRLHTANAGFLHTESLGALESRLDPRHFRRVHRSAIVRWDTAREIVRGPEGALTVITGLGAQVRVGRTFAPDLMALLSLR